jgi:pimeloyl-ACP methyl ester carboxylesterase
MTVASAYQETNGVRLHYLRAGHGPRAIVLTHGNSHCGGVWKPLVERLAGDEFTVLAVDLRGHGWSDKPDAGFDWANLRDDLRGLVEAQGLTEILFAGHSRGGGVALLTAAATPERTRGVLVYEPTVPVQPGPDGGPAPTPVPTRVGEMAGRASRRRQHFASQEELIARYRPRDGFRLWRDDYFAAFLEYGSVQRPDGSVELCMPPRTAARLFEATHGFDAWQHVHCPDLPVMLVYGERSGRLGRGHDPVAGIRTMFPRAEMVMMPGATHTGPMEQPEWFEQRIREFARRIWPA